MNFISLKNISKSFGKGENITWALKDINLNIEKGDFISIVGPSGSGKSTLLNIIGCLDIMTKGTYLLEDKDITFLKSKEIASIRNKKIGFVVQHFALLNDYTVYDNILIPIDYNKEKVSNKKQKVIEVLRSLGIEDKFSKYPSNLSGGQCQRVAIARALINNPDIILADEPTGALDTKTGKEVIDIFKKLNDEGKTVIIVTHNMDIAKQTNKTISIVDGLVEKIKTN